MKHVKVSAVKNKYYTKNTAATGGKEGISAVKNKYYTKNTAAAGGKEGIIYSLLKSH